MKICPDCQNLNPPEARFCDACGHFLEEAGRAAKKESGSNSHQITTVDASGGGVVAIGEGAKAVNVGKGGTYIEQQERHSNEQVSEISKTLKHCPSCEQEVLEKALFCHNCGAKL